MNLPILAWSVLCLTYSLTIGTEISNVWVRIIATLGVTIPLAYLLELTGVFR